MLEVSEDLYRYLILNMLKKTNAIRNEKIYKLSFTSNSFDDLISLLKL